MKKIGLFSSVVGACFLCAGTLNAQDETRQALGLPIMIGQNATSKTSTSLSGRISVQGTNSLKSPFFVSIYLGGALIDRRQATDSGNYYIPSIPRDSVILSVELNGREVGRYQVMPAALGVMRYDVMLTSLEIEKVQGRIGIISAKNLYQRSDSNQRIFDKASSAVREKKIDNAIELYKDLLAKDSKDFAAWTELGTLYFRSQKLSQAEESYVKALEQNPEFGVAQVNLGKLYLEKKEPEKAITILSQAIVSEPNSADAQHYLGESYLQIKKGSKAVGYLNEAIRLAPVEKAEIHLRLAQLYDGAKLKNKAAEEYKLFLEKVPDYKDKDKLLMYIKENPPNQN